MEPRPKKLLDQVRDALRLKHYSIRTEGSYVNWIRRYILFHGKRHPNEMGSAEVEAFLTHLAVKGNVAASTQNQALSALLFLYRDMLHKDLGPIDALRAKKPKRLPTVLTKEEVRRVLGHLSGTHQLMAKLLYGSGLRLMECLRLRVKDIDFAQRAIVVRDGKGDQDRVTMLPDSLIAPLQEHLQYVKRLHEEDLTKGHGAVYLPYALERKYPNANREWIWQYAFPSGRLSVDPRSGVVRRHHLDESGLQRAIRQAARATGISKPVSPHTFRHSFATHLLETLQHFPKHTAPLSSPRPVPGGEKGGAGSWALPWSGFYQCSNPCQFFNLSNKPWEIGPRETHPRRRNTVVFDVRRHMLVMRECCG
jgi:integron integrase